jgi:hypothetical protein
MPESLSTRLIRSVIENYVAQMDYINGRHRGERVTLRYTDAATPKFRQAAAMIAALSRTGRPHAD